MNAAQNARLDKEAHPERYCLKCLWRAHPGKPCPRHGPPLSDSPEPDAGWPGLLLEMRRKMGSCLDCGLQPPYHRHWCQRVLKEVSHAKG
jgi:hypothetical protein